MKLMEQDRLEILVVFTLRFVFFFVLFFLVCKFFYFCFYNMLFIDEVSPCKRLFKVCSYYCFSHRYGGEEGSVFLCLFKMR